VEARALPMILKVVESKDFGWRIVRPSSSREDESHVFGESVVLIDWNDTGLGVSGLDLSVLNVLGWKSVDLSVSGLGLSELRVLGPADVLTLFNFLSGVSGGVG
jgi:hypothetical protein